MLGWLRISNGEKQTNGARRALRSSSRRDPPAPGIANLRFALFPIDERRLNRGAHRAILDAESMPRSTFLPPPPA